MSRKNKKVTKKQSSNDKKNEMNCIVCKERISKGAKVCPRCSHYQVEWRNRLKYIAGNIGLITVIVSALVFIFSNTPKVWSIFFPNKSIEILDFSLDPGNTSISVYNTSDSTIQIAEVMFQIPEYSGSRKYGNETIRLTVAPNKFGSNKSEETKAERRILVYMRMVEPKHWMAYGPGYKSCYTISILDSNHKALEAIRSKTPPPIGEAKGTATIRYFHARSETWEEKTFPIVAYLAKVTKYCPDEEVEEWLQGKN